MYTIKIILLWELVLVDRQEKRKKKMAEIPENAVNMLDKNFSSHYFEIFSYFSQKVGFDVS